MTTIGETDEPRAARRFRDHTLAYAPGELLRWLHRRRGPLAKIGMGTAGYTYLLGPEANRFVFANSDRFRWRDAFDWLVPVDGETSMLLSDGHEHRRRRRLVQPAMNHRQIAGYVDTMTGNADLAIDSWRAGERIDVYRELRAAIRRSTLQALFGPRLAADATFFGDQLQILLDLCDGLPQTVALRRRLSTPEWRKAMAARDRVDERIYAEIEHVRAAIPGKEQTVLASLVHGTDEEGLRLSDVEIRDQTVTLIVAGYETTSAVLGWAVYAMLSTPGVWAKAKAEVLEVLGDRTPTAADLKNLRYLTNVVHETLRLYPAVVVVGRRANEDIEFDGSLIREGSMVIISPYVTHRMPQLWREPTRFRPERWDPRDPGYRKPTPHEFLPFGSGPHRCIGSSMASTELIVMLARLLARTTLSLPAQRIRPASMISLRPARGLLADVVATGSRA
ncbi:hypothetical protein SAMN05421630_11247 [Prauserella marina]|uniref:Uncharacterized protein n=1 Tax=Prauserella marina TaxID=530584 RepID=A0A1G6XEF1_9PSEU|nr:cytochrome P450 [Prauserella marina]PWV72591.1 hypothetical protein DES30_110191 [Prauserella marina]SDD76461.1 hypothetical protein SAMN05421630_11247 [Prauserella marina]